MATIEQRRPDPAVAPADTLTDRHRVAWLLILLGTLGLSFYVSSQPSPDVSTIPWVDLLVKKSGHFTGYALIGGLLATTLWAWAPRVRSLGSAVRTLGSPQRLALVLAFLWASSDEFHQSFSPHRTPAVTDVLLDTCGALVGILIATRIRQRWQGR